MRRVGGKARPVETSSGNRDAIGGNGKAEHAQRVAGDGTERRASRSCGSKVPNMHLAVHSSAYLPVLSHIKVTKERENKCFALGTSDSLWLVRSSLRVAERIRASRRLSGANATPSTLSSCRFSRARTLPVRSHSSTDPSLPPEASSLPSGAQATDITPGCCPSPPCPVTGQPLSCQTQDVPLCHTLLVASHTYISCLFRD
jgi:hypothetical protein